MVPLTESNIRILWILLVTTLVYLAVKFLTKGFISSVSSGQPGAKRLATLTSLVQSTAATVIILIALVMILREAGFDITPLLASAGIVGLAVGFGAQTLVKDIITGFLLLIEDQFDEGDEIEISGKRGTVEKITLRTVWLREKGGTLHIIPNSSVTLVSNFSKK